MAAEANSQPPAPPSAAASGDDARLRTALLIAAGVYVVGTRVAVALAGKGLLSRDVVFGWLMGGPLIPSLNNPRPWVRGVIVDRLPLILVLFAHDYAPSIG